MTPRQLEDEVNTGPVEGLVEVAMCEHEPTKVLNLGKNLGYKLKEKLTYFLKANLNLFAWT